MIRTSLFAFLLLLLTGLLVGCPIPPGGGGDDDDASFDDDDDTPYVQPAPWADMDFIQRLEFMEQVVEPTMKELFVDFDEEEFKDFSCTTCHGDDGSDLDYEMPNGVTPLDLDDFPLSASPDERTRDFDVFMSDEVKPTMAALLDRQPFPQGDFGCFACHEMD
ncbi:MAG: hypothetical protein VX498_05355 [Myxococcota bacterium]|nr:hypothetical protein [Myxococcota bacterium]